MIKQLDKLCTPECLLGYFGPKNESQGDTFTFYGNALTPHLIPGDNYLHQHSYTNKGLGGSLYAYLVQLDQQGIDHGYVVLSSNQISYVVKLTVVHTRRGNYIKFHFYDIIQTLDSIYLPNTKQRLITELCPLLYKLNDKIIYLASPDHLVPVLSGSGLRSLFLLDDDGKTSRSQYTAWLLHQHLLNAHTQKQQDTTTCDVPWLITPIIASSQLINLPIDQLHKHHYTKQLVYHLFSSVTANNQPSHKMMALSYLLKLRQLDETYDQVLYQSFYNTKQQQYDYLYEYLASILSCDGFAQKYQTELVNLLQSFVSKGEYSNNQQGLDFPFAIVALYLKFNKELLSKVPSTSIS